MAKFPNPFRRRQPRGRVLSPFDFLGRYPPRQRIAFVGNAPSMAESENGEHIDGMDIVIRFNTGATAGFEKKVGSRTDILCVHQKFGITRFSPLDMREVATVLQLNNCFTNQLDEDGFWDATAPADAFFAFSPSLRWLADPAHTAGLTTGTQALQLLGRFLEPKEIFLTGFTVFLDSKASDHYFEDRQIDHVKHDFAREREIFCQILNELSCKITATPDIAAVYKSTGIEPGRKLRFVDWAGEPQP